MASRVGTFLLPARYHVEQNRVGTKSVTTLRKPLFIRDMLQINW